MIISRVFRVIISMCLISFPAAAADKNEPLPDVLYQLRDGQSPGSITPQIVRNAVVSLGSQSINPISYGAICNGSAHSITSTLGVSTKAGLAAYATASGTTPYSWITNALWSSPEVALPLVNAASINATTLFFDSTLQIPVGAVVSGTQITGSPTVTAVSNPGTVTAVTNGATTIRGTTSITVNSGTAIPVGSHPVPQAGLSYEDYVVSSTATNITLKYGITATPIPTATTLTFQPPSSVTISGAGLTAAKPSVQSAASSTTVNYWVYFTWTLTDAMVAAAEMDWLGIQAAIEAATALPTGGRVMLPTGKCIMNNATVSGNGLGGLVVHENTMANNQPTGAVDIVGAGEGGTTTLIWSSEMGAGRAAWSHGVPYATWDNGLGRYGAVYYNGKMIDLTMVGPMGTGSPTVGTVQTRTWGLLSGTRRVIDNVTVSGFYVGATMETVDHTAWGNVLLLSNVMNLRMGSVSTQLYGNNMINHLETAAAAIANISLDKNFYWNETNINLMFCGFAPKCIRLEPGTTDSYGEIASTGLLLASDFLSINAESLGLCFICDDNYGPNPVAGPNIAGGQLTVQEMRFHNMDTTYSATYQPAGSPVNYWIQTPNLYRSEFDFLTGREPPSVAGMQSAVYIDNANFGDGGDLFVGSMTSLLTAMGTTPFFTIYGAGFNNDLTSIRVCEVGAWCGHVAQYLSGTTGTQGMALETYWSGAHRVQPAGGTAPFAGILMSATTNGVSFYPAIVATQFCYSGSGNAVGIPTSGTPASSTIYFGKLAAGGTVTNATGPTDGVVIGTIMDVQSSKAFMRIGGCDGWP